MKHLIGLFVLSMTLIQPFAHSSINPEIIALIESSNNPNAFNKSSGAVGLMQITSICLKHFNEVHGTDFVTKDLYSSQLNMRIGTWYLNWLDGRCATDEEILISYNFGYGNMKKWKAGKKKLPQETEDYLGRYEALLRKRK